MSESNSVVNSSNVYGNVYFPFNNDIQFAILKLMIEDEGFAYSCFCHLKECYFKNEYLRWLFSFIKEYHEEYNKIPETITIKNAVLSFEPMQRPGYERIIESVLNVNYTDEDYLRKELTKFVRSEEYKISHNKGYDIFQSGDYEKAYVHTQESIDKIVSIDFEKDNIVDFNNLEHYLENAKRSSKNRIPIGLDIIDKAMLGGLAPQTFTIFLAGTNSAKSIFLINLAYNAIRNHGKKVLFIAHENREEQWVLRFLSRFTGIPYNRFFFSDDNFTIEEHKAIALAKEELSSNLMLKTMYNFETSIEDVIAECKKIKKEKKFDYDLIVNDYCQLLRTKRTVTENRFVQGMVGRGLATIALDLNVAVATVAQSTRTAHQKAKDKGSLVRMTDISECFELCRVAENVITLTKSDDDEANHVMAALLEKQRDGRINIAVQMQTDLSRMATHGTDLKQWDLSDVIDESEEDD